MTKRRAKQPSYAGILIDDPHTLLRWWDERIGVPRLGACAFPCTRRVRPKDLHVTLVRRPDEETLRKLPLGEEVKLRVTGWAANEDVQALVVDCPLPCNNKVPHITIQTAKRQAWNRDEGAYVLLTVEAVEANTLLAEGPAQEIDGPLLTGRVGFEIGGEFRFDLEDTS